MPHMRPIEWPAVDTVLLDMDGTLLDLSFDNHFWLDLVPRHYGQLHGLELAEARRVLAPRFRAVEGTLDWYCIDYWSRELGFDVAAIKNDARERVMFHPGAQEFLARLAARSKRRVLLTNAHPRTLAIKDQQVGLQRHFEAMYSTHPFGLPKEDPGFWPRFHATEAFDPGRTLFVDDSPPVLRAAQSFGVAWLRAILLPDSTRPPRAAGEFDAVHSVAELI